MAICIPSEIEGGCPLAEARKTQIGSSRDARGVSHRRPTTLTGPAQCRANWRTRKNAKKKNKKCTWTTNLREPSQLANSSDGKFNSKETAPRKQVGVMSFLGKSKATGCIPRCAFTKRILFICVDVELTAQGVRTPVWNFPACVASLVFRSSAPQC
eukprot:GHVT01032872.1.p1 GENE.GHVT01032872.1~~GHVT01032872.1.p1  ORF type:complete len:156 (+),score=5.00 GHVT01032872.1:434-901(+)